MQISQNVSTMNDYCCNDMDLLHATVTTDRKPFIFRAMNRLLYSISEKQFQSNALICKNGTTHSMDFLHFCNSLFTY